VVYVLFVEPAVEEERDAVLNPGLRRDTLVSAKFAEFQQIFTETQQT
jgi:hypothetical protein